MASGGQREAGGKAYIYDNLILKIYYVSSLLGLCVFSSSSITKLNSVRSPILHFIFVNHTFFLRSSFNSENASGYTWDEFYPE